MQSVYILFIVSAFISIISYKSNKIALYAGFGGSIISCLYATIYFIKNISLTQGFELFGNFLFSPTFELNPLGNFFSFVVCFIGFASSIYALGYAKEYAKKANLGVFACLFNLFLLSMLLVISANNVFSFIVLWELMTLISALLIMVNDQKGANNAVMVYLGIAQIGAFCILIGLLIMSYFAGSMEFSEFNNLNLSPLMSAFIFILFLVGFGSKAGMWPFHVWLPLAHPAAPSNVSALMSGVMIKVALFALIKFVLFIPLTPAFGIIIVILGAASSLFGVLYALTQHDYKALLAYHSVENIGIILLGLGTGIYGLGAGNFTLAAIGFLGGLYHVVNHALFKGLLFLCAGSVLHATHTRDMEILGGLAKKMPWTSIGMFIGIMGIAALPPVNGFVSEWLTYQGMLQGALGEGVLVRYIFTLGVVALALTGVLVVMHLKLYAVIFAGTPRNKEIWEKAKESPLPMVLGMIVLMLGCIGFGVGASGVVSFISNAVNFIAPSSYDPNLGEMGAITSTMGSYISTPLIAIIMAGSMVLPFVLLALFKANSNKAKPTDPWATGFKYSSRMQMTASPFTGDLRKIMEWLFRAKPIVKSNGYFEPVVYENHTRDIWWDKLYVPVIKFCKKIADKIGIFQNGYSNLYAGYILIYLCLILIFSYYFF